MTSRLKIVARNVVNLVITSRNAHINPKFAFYARVQVMRKKTEKWRISGKWKCLYIFLSFKSALSNWNTDYPFAIDETDYLGVEQYVMEKKCWMFGDNKATQVVLFESEPRKMRNIGNHIRQYDHGEWVDM